jgi:hypothetical protein
VAAHDHAETPNRIFIVQRGELPVSDAPRPDRSGYEAVRLVVSLAKPRLEKCILVFDGNGKLLGRSPVLRRPGRQPLCGGDVRRPHSEVSSQEGHRSSFTRGPAFKKTRSGRSSLTVSVR